jgi:hypothetical protein
MPTITSRGSRSPRRWVKLVVSGGGTLSGLPMMLYGHALAALLVPICVSFHPPFDSGRCRQPMVWLVLGRGLGMRVARPPTRSTARSWRNAQRSEGGTWKVLMLPRRGAQRDDEEEGESDDHAAA